MKLLAIELRKLRGTLALALCFLAPALVALVAIAIALRQAAPGWTMIVTNTFGLWAYFVLPMTTAALAALVAQIEHGPRAWDHLFALPVRRMPMLLAKAAVLMLMLGLMSVLLVLLCFLLGMIVQPDAAAFPWGEAVRMAGASWAASCLMAVIELWTALRFRSFVPPIALGLTGTFVVVAAMGAPEAAMVPWAMPLASLGLPGGDPFWALAAGGLGGLVLMVAMTAHLARRDV
jgi:ABC-2 type transport system permease protein